MPLENKFEPRYIELLNRVIETGEQRQTRAGPTRALFGEKLYVGSITDDGFPMLTTRKLYPRSVWGELAAFVRGATMLSEFQELGCNYWNDNALAWPANLGLVRDKLRVGKIYGAQWRNFNGVDQLVALVHSLRSDPLSRRHLLTTYNPAEVHLGCLPPCHLMAQFNVTGDQGLDCVVYMRSVDLCVGLPADIILYATLMMLLAEACELYPHRLTFMFGDTHVYENHVSQWFIQRDREPLSLPIAILDNVDLFKFTNDNIQLQYYKHHEPIPYKFNV